MNVPLLLMKSLIRGNYGNCKRAILRNAQLILLSTSAALAVPEEGEVEDCAEACLVE